MDRTEYISKMNLMLDDKMYTQLNKNPTFKVELKICMSVIITTTEVTKAPKCEILVLTVVKI